MVNVSSLNPAHNFFTKHHNLEEAGPESWRVRCMSTQLIDEGDLINEMNNEQKITATARQENGLRFGDKHEFPQGQSGRRRKSMEAKKIRSEWKNMNSKGDESELSVNKNIHRDLFILVYYITNVDNK